MPTPLIDTALEAQCQALIAQLGQQPAPQLARRANQEMWQPNPQMRPAGYPQPWSAMAPDHQGRGQDPQPRHSHPRAGGDAHQHLRRLVADLIASVTRSAKPVSKLQATGRPKANRGSSLDWKILHVGAKLKYRAPCEGTAPQREVDPPSNCRSSRYVEFGVMWIWAGKPLPRNTFCVFCSTQVHPRSGCGTHLKRGSRLACPTLLLSVLSYGARPLSPWSA